MPMHGGRKNKGKKFEEVVHKSFECVPDVSVTRLKDDVSGYKNVANPCDFLVYHKPHLYAIECKSTHDHTMSIYSKSSDPEKPHDYGMITNKQWEGLLEMSTIKGVHAGILVWFVEDDETLFFDINLLKRWRDAGHKSIHSYPEWIEYVESECDWCYITGKKKRIYYEYDMQTFLNQMEGKDDL